MILYYLDHSPFAARVHLAILAKGLDVDLKPPPGGALSDSYRTRSPIGLVPSLELDDGRVIAESQIILEFLEDRFPEPSLRPADPVEGATARLLAQVVDLYLAEPLKRLFERAKRGSDASESAGTDPALRSDRQDAGAALDHIAHYLGGRDPEALYAVGDKLSTADCALVTILFFVDRARALFGEEDPFSTRPALDAYWARIASDPNVEKVLGIMANAQARRAQQRAAGQRED